MDFNFLENSMIFKKSFINSFDFEREWSTITEPAPIKTIKQRLRALREEAKKDGGNKK